jgi:signal transduction histidine kinase
MTARIRLLVDHDRNRDLLAERLAGRYEVNTDPGEEAIEETDLCVLDEAGFERHRERVTDWKDRADPVFAPVLLVAEDSYEDLVPETWETVDGLYVVDDVVVAPVGQAVLLRRLENLLSRRALSTDLAESYRRSEERFASLFQAMPDPALVFADGHVTYVNDAFCARYGADRDDVRWRHLSELAAFPPDSAEAVRAQIERAVDRADDAESGVDPTAVETWASDGGATTDPGTGVEAVEADTVSAGDAGASGGGATEGSRGRAGAEGWGYDTETVVVETATGERRYVETNVKPLTVDDRRSVALVMRDVTERRERKRTLERQNERLEEFASIVSHDLRNPLQVLAGRLQAIDAEREADREVALDAHVPSMHRSVDRMHGLVEDLLTLAQQGEAVSDPEPVSLAAVAGGAWGTTDAPEADLAIRTGRPVLGDESRLRQLFENLFRNAIEHGGQQVSVVVDDLPDGEGFFLADDGPGIPEDERAAVLEMGYTNSDDGTGIGLGVVSQVAQAHGWEVTLAESADGGARFEFRGVDG